MYCPKCGGEYREGFSKCSDCGTALESGSPATAPQTTDNEPSEANVEFVVVMRTGRIWEVEMVENAFTNAKLPHYQQSETSSGLVLAKQLAPAMGPGEWWSFWVPKKFQEEAEKILATLPMEVTTNPDVWHFNPPEEGKWFFKNYAIFVLIAMLISIILAVINFLRE